MNEFEISTGELRKEDFKPPLITVECQTEHTGEIPEPEVEKQKPIIEPKYDSLFQIEEAKTTETGI